MSLLMRCVRQSGMYLEFRIKREVWQVTAKAVIQAGGMRTRLRNITKDEIQKLITILGEAAFRVADRKV